MSKKPDGISVRDHIRAWRAGRDACARQEPRPQKPRVQVEDLMVLNGESVRQQMLSAAGWEVGILWESLAALDAALDSEDPKIAIKAARVILSLLPKG